MSVFDHVEVSTVIIINLVIVYYPFHHDHINTPRKHPLITPFELQMVGGVAWKLGGYNPPGGSGILDKSLPFVPVHVREEMDFCRFKRFLKTHIFSLAH